MESQSAAQRIYSQIVRRGYRNAPTYKEVLRDQAQAARLDPFMEMRY